MRVWLAESLYREELHRCAEAQFDWLREEARLIEAGLIESV